MKVQVIILALAGIFGSHANQLEVTPIQKVLTLLNGMLEKGKQEKHKEEINWARNKQVCGDTQEVKVASIMDEEETIEGLDAEIKKDVADSKTLLAMIAHLDRDRDIWSHDIIAAQKVRNIEKSDFDDKHKDLSESIDAIDRAKAVLKKQTADRRQKASFAQTDALSRVALMVPPQAKKAIDAFLQTSGENKDASDIEGAPEANAYEFHSSGVIDILEKLQDKFIDERTAAEKEESNSKHAHEMLRQKLKAEIEEALGQSTSKATERGDVLASKAIEESDMSDEVDTKAVDEAFLKDFKADCTMKEEDYEARQKLRAEEMEMIEKAVTLLSGDAVAGNGEKHLPQLIQLRNKAASLGQLRSNLNTEDQKRVAQLFREQAKKLNSRILALVASRVAEDPFQKVKKIIKDLLVRLMEEANEEAAHKGWCDTELSTNEQTRKEKTHVVEELHAEIDQLSASVSKITEDITELTSSIAELDAAVAKATSIRQEESKQNKETIADAEDAQTALAQGLTMLNDFYAKAAESKAAEASQQEEGGGVVALLEVIQSDFARLEAETKSSEDASQEEFDRFITDSKVDKAQKSKDVEHKTHKKQDQSQALTEKKKDLVGTQKELDSALAYFDRLKPSCVDSGESYEDRVERRKDEISSLQDGLRILNGEELA